MRHKILVATTNPGKIAELSALLNINAELLGLKEFDGLAEVPETGLACKQSPAGNDSNGAVSHCVRHAETENSPSG